MESSIAVFLMRQLACEQLPTLMWKPEHPCIPTSRVVLGLHISLGKGGIPECTQEHDQCLGIPMCTWVQ